MLLNCDWYTWYIVDGNSCDIFFWCLWHLGVCIKKGNKQNAIKLYFLYFVHNFAATHQKKNTFSITQFDGLTDFLDQKFKKPPFRYHRKLDKLGEYNGQIYILIHKVLTYQKYNLSCVRALLFGNVINTRKVFRESQKYCKAEDLIPKRDNTM